MLLIRAARRGGFKQPQAHAASTRKFDSGSGWPSFTRYGRYIALIDGE
jgi:peptide methionine sulfoxide reductase MsrB